MTLRGGFQAEHGQSVPGLGGAEAPAALFMLHQRVEMRLAQRAAG